MTATWSDDSQLFGVPIGLLRPGANVVDIGASTGEFARPAHDRMCRVLCVEAWQPNVRRLRDQGLRVLPAVAGGHDGVARMAVPDGAEETTGAFAILHGQSDPCWTVGWTMTAPVPMVSLETILDCAGSFVTAMKVDIEGGEYHLFSHADPRTLERIEFLTIEHHAWTVAGEPARPGVGARPLGPRYRTGASAGLCELLTHTHNVTHDGVHDEGGTITAILR